MVKKRKKSKEIMYIIFLLSCDLYACRKKKRNENLEHSNLELWKLITQAKPLNQRLSLILKPRQRKTMTWAWKSVCAHWIVAVSQLKILADLREERKDVALHVQRRLDTIYLYGTDDMSTDDVFNYFKDYGPSFVEWINDSSCTKDASYCTNH